MEDQDYDDENDGGLFGNDDYGDENDLSGMSSEFDGQFDDSDDDAPKQLTKKDKKALQSDIEK